MQSIVRPSYAPNPSALPQVDHGELFRTLRLRLVRTQRVPSPCPRTHLTSRRRAPSSPTAAGSPCASRSSRACSPPSPSPSPRCPASPTCASACRTPPPAGSPPPRSLQLASCLAFVAAFRGVFCHRLPWRLSYEVGMAAQGTNVLLPSGGAGGLALAAWALTAHRHADRAPRPADRRLLRPDELGELLHGGHRRPRAGDRRRRAAVDRRPGRRRGARHLRRARAAASASPTPARVAPVAC